MTLIPLNRRNFVNNQVETRPTVDYVSASNFFTNYDEVLLDSPGVSGGVRAIGTYSPRIKEINPYYFADHPNNTNIVQVREDLNGAFRMEQSDTSSLGYVRNYLDHVNNLDVLCKNTWKFGIERIQQRYMPYDINFHKKNTIKNNVYKDYMNHKGSDHIENLNWSFSNYNCINFFTIGKGDEQRTGFSDSVIHSNAIIYPNIATTTNQQYDFTRNSPQHTFSFWINPRYKQPVGQSRNSGCIINIPGFIDVYLVGGTEKDLSNLETTFRIGVKAGINNATSFNSFNLSENSNQTLDKTFLTIDCLNYNNWHNVVVTTNKNIASNRFSVEIFVDKQKVSSFTTSYNNNLFKDYLLFSSLICIGNKVPINTLVREDEIDPTHIEETVKLLFNSTESGPGSNKFISAGSERSLPTLDSSVITANNVFSTIRSESNALEAEIHDIRIYNEILSLNKIEEIYIRSITNVDQEKNIGLIFYVPSYFVPEHVRKKTFVNASSNETNRIADVIFDFVTNPYYFNNCGGHYVTSELFLLEWIKGSRPNIVLGNKIDDDYSNSIIETLTLTSNYENSSYKNSKLGMPYHEMYLSQSLTSNNSEIQTKSHVYNNNLIMPCDNGLQYQNFDIIKSHFQSGYVTSSYMYKDNIGNTSYKEVSVERSFLQDINDDYYLLPVSLTSNAHLKDSLYPAISVEPNLQDLELSSEKVIDQPRNNYLFNISNANYHENDNRRYLLNDFNYPDRNYFRDEHSNSNPVVRNYSEAGIDSSGNYIESINRQGQWPLYKITQDPVENYSVIFSISNQLYNRKIRKNTFSIVDYDLFGTANTVKVKLKESGRGLLYRADCLTKHAEWNHIGHIFYSEGFCTILHPSLYNFGKTNFRAKFEGENATFVSEVNIPLESGKFNKSNNKSYKDDILISDSAYEQDQKFVYISEINLHDESLNIVARAKLAQPVVKRNTDNLVFRLKMDY